MEELEWAACKLCFVVASLSFHLLGIVEPLMLVFCLNHQQFSFENTQTFSLKSDLTMAINCNKKNSDLSVLTMAAYDCNLQQQISWKYQRNITENSDLNEQLFDSSHVKIGCLRGGEVRVIL